MKKEDLIKSWEKVFNKYEISGLGDKPTIFTQEILPYIKNKKTLLELGTGLGQDSIFFNEKGFTVTSTDFSGYALGKAKEKDVSKNINFKEVDISNKLPFNDESFDVVYSHLSLHYFDKIKTKEILKEIHRVLKSGGIFATILNTTNDPEIIRYNYEKIEDDFYKDNAGVEKRYFSIKSIKELTENLFKPLLVDDKGKTYKDDIETLIRFVGKKL